MLKKIILAFGISQIWILCVSLVSFNFLPLQPSYLGVSPSEFLNNPLVYSRANFDGYHYLSIAQRGYGYAQQAFFPLYPNLIRLTSNLIAAPIYSALIISCLSYLIGLILLYKLISLDYFQKIAFWSVVSLIIFPTSFYFSFVYTEGIFFCLLVGSIYLSRKNHLLFSAVLGAFASYCRLVGIFIVPVLLLDLYQQKKLTPLRFIICLLPALGLAYYMYQLQITTGDYLAFLHTQVLFHQGRSTQLILLPQVIWRYIQMVITVDRSLPLYLTIIIEFSTAIIFGFLSLISWKKLRISYAFLVTMFYLVPTLTGTFTSLPRYILVGFPYFILLGQWFTASDSRVKLLYCVASVIFSFICISLFVSGFWLA